VARRSGLGKGLGALIPTDVVGERGSIFLEIPVNDLRPNRNQPRRNFHEEGLAALTASVLELGVLQPVLVRQVEDGAYEIIAGERRWRAAKRAGFSTIPAIVREAGEIASIEQALVENLHRKDLNPLEEAAAYQQLIEDFGLTHEQLATRVGKSRVAVTNTLRLFQLPPSVQRMLAEDQLTAGHARALLGTPDRAFQEALARRTVAEQLTVRTVEEAVRARNELGGFAPGAGRPAKLRPPGIVELEDLLSNHLDTRVRVDFGPRTGKVVIDFADLDDLERIYRAMTDRERA
jgi:ParB family chromosome partitioning protein